MRKQSVLFLLFISVMPGIKPLPKKQLSLAVAADMKFAMDSVIWVFQGANSNANIQVTYGSSGNFFQQLSNDAPFDMFFSADKEYAENLSQGGLTATSPVLYGIGQIVLWSKKIDPNKAAMQSLLENTISNIAIANPAHAPYGRCAVESMKYYHVYEKAKGKLVLGENISQTAQFVTSGAAGIGIIALSLAVAPTMQNQGGKYYLIPEKSHKPLEQ